ncbi:hypothetical protein V1523DRAFT_411298 [Lipomyces doorenjongii]
MAFLILSLYYITLTHCNLAMEKAKHFRGAFARSGQRIWLMDVDVNDSYNLTETSDDIRTIGNAGHRRIESYVLMPPESTQ